ncbi:carbon monoxide dehydrogenase [Sulfodiicoccus acidiphilus]|uniref:Carbon monoxide dehydrogenase n=1 Tax=Sulfodiicoccus acidiphilus TaxID=1670455 RepID=A0A348B1K3_9CREN|nr:carbon monoxide dehydrogenase subunit G [Sulfodiicoccus acidiphilus]BBD72055.1 carbon monoxide dehydrogenase [Sulfodiicoccus acidiphilus]GGU00102.1 carbon monoxide dehydrogenase [Sulfodiicoccus acidiphilus]
MLFEGNLSVNSTRDKVWNFLYTPEKAVSCLPGFKDVRKEGDSYRVTGKTGIGFLKGDYKANFRYSEVQQPSKVTLLATGSGMGGTMELKAEVNLEGDGPVNLRWSSEVKVGGSLASVGARVVQGAAQRIIEDLFQCVKEKVERT